jgi:hypothetical protein
MSFVTCKLFAQRGNMLFQIACCASHAWRHAVDFKIPRQGHSPELPVMPWPHLPEWTPADGLGAPYVEHQDQFGLYHDMPYWPKMRLHGYFQNELYFKDYRDKIIELFQVPYNPMKGVVGIHVRRGDYLLYPTKYITPDHDYLSRSIQYFTDMGYETFSIFSDDMPWCKEYFTRHYPFLGFTFHEGNDAGTDMSLLSSCEHQIISASTFSWWAAWLNQNPYKVVIAPKSWFGPGNNHLNSSQIVPTSWIRM